MDSEQVCRAPKLDIWHALEQSGALQCPVCGGGLHVAETRFRCLECASVYPVESGVPLLLPPAEVTSIPEQVMGAFNIPLAWKEQVATALTPLTKYRSHSQPEFSNFFARFDQQERQMEAVTLTVEETAAAVAQVECLTQCMPQTLPSEQVEFRSIRLRNGSDRVLFTDERNPLYLSYKLFTSGGAPVAFEASLSALPCPLRPGKELTVPVMMTLPPGLAGPFIVRFYFVLVRHAAAPAASSYRQRARAWLASLRHGIRQRWRAVGERNHVHWFDAAALAEVRATVVLNQPPFPATHRGTLAEFEVHEDARRADAFVSDVLTKMRAAGIAKPRMLEIGAGIHPILLRVSDSDMTVIVSDISLVMQTLAGVLHSNNAAVLDGRVGFASFDMMYPPFRDGSFDIICICAALHHVAFPEQFLRRMARLLAPQGRFVAVREPCMVSPSEPTYITELANGFNEQMFELSEWREMIDHGGLGIDQAVIDFDCSLKFCARLAQAKPK